MEAALYDADHGFFARGGGAGRGGRDFITSPEVGELFGVLVGRFLDRCWERLGRPDPFLVVDAGAGPGTLAASVLRSSPACSPALRYVLVESSPVLRKMAGERLPLEPPALALGPFAVAEPDESPVPVTGGGPLVAVLASLPAFRFDGVVIANELLDNLPACLAQRRDGAWHEVRVGLASGTSAASRTDAGLASPSGADAPCFIEMSAPASPALAAVAEALAGDLPVPEGSRLPVPVGMDRWLVDVAGVLRRGIVAVIDYADTASGLLQREPGEWLRTYRGHARAGSPLQGPGSCDITIDVCLEALRRGAERVGLSVEEELTQARWLAGLDLASLVTEARAAWHGRLADNLAALAARSRVQEADALTDPAGLGSHHVTVLSKGFPAPGGIRFDYPQAGR